MKKHSHFLSTQFITPAISTTLVLVLLGTIVFFVLTARNLSNYVKENINITILISDELNSKQIEKLRADFGKTNYVKSIKYISKEQALQDATTDMGTDPSEFLGYNPFTASFEVKIKAEYTNTDQIDKIVSKIKKNPAVVDVIYQRDLIKAVNRNLHLCIEMFRTREDTHLKEIEELEDKVDQMERDIQDSHIERMTKGICSPEAGIIFNDIVTGLERVCDHATNIAFSVLKNEQ